MQIRTEITIAASPTTVWRALTDFAAYPQWNPFLREASGAPVAGGKLRLAIAGPGGRTVTIRPTVLVADEGRELTWRGRLLVPGLVDGRHFFRLVDLGGGRTQLLHGEDFSGILVALLGRTLAGVQAQFVALNEALKERVEQAARSHVS